MKPYELGGNVKSLTDRTWEAFSALIIPNAFWAVLATLILKTVRPNIMVRWSRSKDLYQVAESGISIFVNQRNRVRLFQRGVSDRVEFLASSYGVLTEKWESGFRVLDCGANIGEFSRAMELRGAIVDSFEPAEAEWRCLVENLQNPSSRAWQMALGSRNEIGKLFGSNSGGNATLVLPKTPAVEGTAVNVVSLDSWAQEFLPGTTPISIFKLEAEGAEGDVLRGARQTLKRVQVVCVDMGESSVSSDNAVAEVTDILYDSGFRMAAFTKARSVGVFEKK